MNVIIANRYQELLAGLDIDVIKSMTGEFAVDELIDTFSNFFFNKMVLDVTALKEYNDTAILQKLSMNLDTSKIVLLLDDNATITTPEYVSALVSMGLYNFTKTVDNVKYLIDNPNSYKDVAQYHKIGAQPTTVINTVIENQAPSAPAPMSFAPSGPKILGIKNVTSHAGSTTLVYMLKKQLSQTNNVLGVEINRTDFVYFSDQDLISVQDEEFAKTVMKSNNYDIILVDLNDSANEDMCTDILYLIEPSTIKLNKMIRRNKNIFQKLKGKKVVLNKSLLDNKDINDFVFESNSQVYFNITPLDDKINKHPVLDELMATLGYITFTTPTGDGTDESGSFLNNLFKK